MTFNEKLRHLVFEALHEDVGDGDHSTMCCIPEGIRGKAVLKIKQDGILAGVDVAEQIFHIADATASFKKLKPDGEQMYSGEKAFEVMADIRTILTCERLVLNCMQRMSGIATLTRRYTKILNGYKTRILD